MNLSPAEYSLINQIKDMITEFDRAYEESIQDLEDDSQSMYYCGKSEACKDILKLINGNNHIRIPM